MAREKILQRLYYWFWRSEDFCEDFEAAWYAIYHDLWDGREGDISDEVLKCAYSWAREWLVENGYITVIPD